MTTQEKINAILYNDNITDAITYLYDRWQEEKEYEKINDYGIAIVSAINKEMPILKASCIQATKRPFGVKFYIDGKLFHFYIKVKDRNHLNIYIEKV